MKTEDLIAKLAAQPAPPPLSAPRMAWQMVAATALSAAVVLAMIGIRDDLLAAITSPFVMAKTLLPAALAILTLPLLLARLRPQSRPGLWPLALPLFVALGLLVAGLATRPAAARFNDVSPFALTECIGLILLISALPIALALRLMRRGASTQPALTGALTGLAISAASATGYSLFCTQDNPIFYVVWYGTAIALATLAAAIAGSRLLRW